MLPNGTSKELLGSLSGIIKTEFKEQKYILSYEEYMDIFVSNAKNMVRNSAQYMIDMFEYFGISEVKHGFHAAQKHFNLFDASRGRNKPKIVGQEEAHEALYRILKQFARQGKSDKLILLHGPNGSSKSSTADAIAHALEDYSRTDEGAVYRFNWIFPTDKIGHEGLLGETNANKHIGFGDASAWHNAGKSFAHLQDDEIMCKIISEMRENPIFILPKLERIHLYKKYFGKEAEETSIPVHLEEGALSSKNKKIFDSLLVAYKGDFEKVLRHIQVERFFFSSRYRTGIASVEPQMAMDAMDKQINIEKNLQNLPPVLQNIRLFEPCGELIDANRGFVEFSDLLKRPLEAFKYLLTTIEKMSINLQSGMADLDLLMLASSNEKHLDAFKNSQDWPSFKGRFELVRVPYLLSAKLEENIYQEDVKIIENTKKIAPHALSLLTKWAVLTRLRQPDPDFYIPEVRHIISRLNPYDKLALYDGRDPSDIFNDTEKSLLKKNIKEILKESHSSIAYEGRFGASPREVKMLLYFAAQNDSHDALSAIAIFNEIEKLTLDRTVYDYLQFEARGGYHDFRDFLKYVKMQYAQKFHSEFLASLNFYNAGQYVSAMQHYLKNVTANLQNEKIHNEITGRQEVANEMMMFEMESLIFNSGSKKENREKLVSKIAAWRVENPTKELQFETIFNHELHEISNKIYQNKSDEIAKIQLGMTMFESADYKNLSDSIRIQCENTFENLEIKFGYTRKTVWESLIFLNSLPNSNAG